MMKEEEKDRMSVVISNLFCYNCSTLFSKIDNFKSHHCHNISELKSLNKKSSSSKVKEPKKSIITSKPKQKSDDHKNKTKTTSVKMKSDTKAFYGRVKGVNGKSVFVKSRSTYKELEDYMHCCRCYMTFYKLPDLIKHFKDCQVKRNDTFQEYKTTEKTVGEMNIKIVSVSSVQTKVSLENHVESSSNNKKVNNTDDECLKKKKVVEVRKSLENIVAPRDQNNQDSMDSLDSSFSPASPIHEDTSDIDVPSGPSSPSLVQNNQVKEEEKDEKESEIKSEDESKKNKSNNNKKRRRKVKPSSSSFPTADPSNIEFPFLTCPICFRIFKSPADMKQHKLRHGEKNVKCHLCTYTCRLRTSFYDHMRKKHPEKDTYRCYKYPVCPMTFARHEDMKAHRTTHRTKRYYCTEPGCTRSYVQKAPLLDHQNSHKKLRPHICEKCGASFVTRYQLYAHFIIHRNPSYKCDFEGCDKTFKCVTLLKYHKIVHLPEKPVKCTVAGCHVTFYTAKSQRNHVKIIHNKEQENLCPLCGKSYPSNSGFKRHLLTHTNEKKVPCTFEGCSMTFLDKAYLRRHMKTHTGEKPYECRHPSCGKKFSASDTRKRHEQTHTNATPFVCAFCPEAFPDNRPLKKHVLSYHEEEEFDITVPSSYRAQKTK